MQGAENPEIPLVNILEPHTNLAGSVFTEGFFCFHRTVIYLRSAPQGIVACCFWAELIIPAILWQLCP